CIRDLTTLVGKTAHGSTQVVIVHPAEAMNRAAANALLKTLEEPNGSVVLILVSDHPAGLLPTIRSRCQLINCQPPSAEIAFNWLEQQLATLPKKADRPDARRLLGLADGLPYSALRLAESGHWAAQELICTQFMAALVGQHDVIHIAQEWSKLAVAEVLMIIATLVQDMVRLSAGASERQLYYPHHAVELAKVIAVQSPGQLWSLWQDILMARRRAISTANPNVVLLFEALLIPYSR
ncbi:MAG: hypothetical protein M3R00_08180, partial [Pseudomonadota bacterium]|nr:hypothetical protein [Pseudomonadota bacterium]